MDLESKTKAENTVVNGPLFTQPFGLTGRLKPPKSSFDFIPLVDLIVIALLLSLLFTRFVVLPGVRVDLPLPEMRIRHTNSEMAVLTIGHSGMLFFNGSVYDQSSIVRAFSAFVKRSNDTDVGLLMKIQANLDIQSFMGLCQAAQEAGFSQVQVSGKKSEEMTKQIPRGLIGLPGSGQMISP